MSYPRGMSYEYQPDGGLHVYKATGEGWYINDGNLEDAKAYVTALLEDSAKSINPLPFLGKYGTAYSYFEFTPDQLKRIHGAAAKHGYIGYYTQVALAEKLGVSRQAIHDRIKRGSLRSVIVDGHPVVLEWDLPKEEKAKVSA